MDLLNRDDPLFLFAQKLMANVADGSSTSFEASSSDFRYYPERRHSLALQYLSQGAKSTKSLRDSPLRG